MQKIFELLIFALLHSKCNKSACTFTNCLFLGATLIRNVFSLKASIFVRIEFWIQKLNENIFMNHFSIQ